jgi:5'-3' exonuclease
VPVSIANKFESLEISNQATAKPEQATNQVTGASMQDLKTEQQNDPLGTSSKLFVSEFFDCNKEEITEEIIETEPIEVDEDADDPVKLWEEGWKQRYYKVKFDVEEDDVDFTHKIAWHYTVGLQWVLKYYYQGVPAWNWYYPYHYAPFASDFVNISEYYADFSYSSEPFKPFEQLMAVFPAASRKHVPGPWQQLMTEEVDLKQEQLIASLSIYCQFLNLNIVIPKTSPILDFYPDDFQVDKNGKKQAWQGVALLPFVDEKRLRNALKSLNDQLTPEERMFAWAFLIFHDSLSRLK